MDPHASYIVACLVFRGYRQQPKNKVFRQAFCSPRTLSGPRSNILSATVLNNRDRSSLEDPPRQACHDSIPSRGGCCCRPDTRQPHELKKRTPFATVPGRRTCQCFTQRNVSWSRNVLWARRAVFSLAGNILWIINYIWRASLRTRLGGQDFESLIISSKHTRGGFQPAGLQTASRLASGRWSLASATICSCS